MRCLYSRLDTAPSREQNFSIASRQASSFFCCLLLWTPPWGGWRGKGSKGQGSRPPAQALFKKSSCVSCTWWEIGFPPPGVCRGALPQLVGPINLQAGPSSRRQVTAGVAFSWPALDDATGSPGASSCLDFRQIIISTKCSSDVNWLLSPRAP